MNKGNTANAVNATNGSSGFQRNFLIFSSEDAGYEAGQKPSGHIKLEVREGRGKLHAAVQNLRHGNGRFVYKLYLLRSGNSAAAYVGQLMPEPNKAELEWSFDPRNTGDSGFPIGEFDIAAVLVEYADHPVDTVICPLVAYRNRKVEWRNGLKTALMKKRFEAVAEIHMKPETDFAAESAEKLTEVSKAEDTAESVYEESYIKPAGMSEAIREEFHAGSLPMQQEYITQEYTPFEQTLPDNNREQFINEYIPQENDSRERILPEQSHKDNTAFDNVMQENFEPGQITPEQINPEQLQKNYIAPENIPQQQNAQYQAIPGQVDTGCVYLNGNMCGAFVNNGAGTVNPCATCHLHHGRPCYTEPPAGDISQLRGELDRYFEQCDPFHSNRSDYTWWRVGNPVNLNNLLYQCNIRSPLLFNPAVMMAHYKYRHLIVGIFRHRDREKQYVVCGVPGMSLVDKKPFGDMSRWVQAEGNRPRYGAFGYWLVYIDPEGGKILNMNQE